MNTAWVMELSPTLFWDTDRALLDPHVHLKSIVERVVERGTWDDWQCLKSHVSDDELRGLLPRLRLPPRERHFLESVLGPSEAMTTLRSRLQPTEVAMTWNHRVVKRVQGEEVSYAIHEVYYDESGNVEGWTENPTEPFGESFDELKADLERFREAVKKPVLTETVGADGKPTLVPFEK